MAQQISSSNNGTRHLFTTILWTGFLAGTLDILGAIINYKISGGDKIVKIFQFIASGAFGKKAFSGNPVMAYWGILFHFIIAYAFTILFFLLANKIRWVVHNKIVAGIIYGIFIWLVMNLLVLPLSEVPGAPFHLQKALIGAGILVIAIGLPVSLIANAYYHGK